MNTTIFLLFIAFIAGFVTRHFIPSKVFEDRHFTKPDKCEHDVVTRRHGSYCWKCGWCDDGECDKL